VYFDSPMGAAATELYASHPELFDAETRELFKAGKRPLDFPKLRTVMSGEESRALNAEKGPMVIIAGSGMCNAGRIVSHLRQHLDKPETQVVFTGFQAHGTLGRNIADGRSPVQVKGQPVEVKARRHMLRGFSAHAGQTDLVAWAREVAEDRPRFVLTHGEDVPRATLKGRLESELNVDVGLPTRGDVLEV
jgi:metallo-beta-lactamase family protein